jgi:hypothetical protein
MFPEIIIYHNRLEDWLMGIGIAVLFFLSVLAAKRIVHKKLTAFAAKTATIWDDLLAELIDRLNVVFLLVLDIQQAINLDILKQFDAAGISFAYPTQTLMVQS